MKRKLLLIGLVLIVVFNGNAQIVKKIKWTPNPKLSINDRKNYILSVDTKKIRLFDSLAYYGYKAHKKVLHFAAIPLELKNNANDTLKYSSMSCSWNDIYLTDNAIVNTEMKSCFSNFPISVAIAPHKLNRFWVRFFIRKHQVKDVRFRVGMILRKVIDDKDRNFPFYIARKDKQDVI